MNATTSRAQSPEYAGRTSAKARAAAGRAEEEAGRWAPAPVANVVRAASTQSVRRWSEWVRMGRRLQRGEGLHQRGDRVMRIDSLLRRSALAPPARRAQRDLRPDAERHHRAAHQAAEVRPVVDLRVEGADDDRVHCPSG